jgi:hypothetical protein
MAIIKSSRTPGNATLDGTVHASLHSFDGEARATHFTIQKDSGSFTLRLTPRDLADLRRLFAEHCAAELEGV